ncbi:hypothetical protein [Solibacillus sp. R5-41]|nr:hypothetical protein [Solibacillus sp. R5-41]
MIKNGNAMNNNAMGGSKGAVKKFVIANAAIVIAPDTMTPSQKLFSK